MDERRFTYLKVGSLVSIVGAGFFVIFILGIVPTVLGPPREDPVPFSKIMYRYTSQYSNLELGVFRTEMIPDYAFVTGENITFIIKVYLLGSVNENLTILNMVFPDAFCHTRLGLIQDYEIMPWEWNQSQAGVWEVYQINLTFSYLNEGSYGVNMTVVGSPSETYIYQFTDLVQIQPQSYLEERRTANLANATNFEILGLTVVAVGPVVGQVLDSVRELNKRKTNSAVQHTLDAWLHGVENDKTTQCRQTSAEGLGSLCETDIAQTFSRALPLTNVSILQFENR
jgi:hypothetical protein